MMPQKIWQKNSWPYGVSLCEFLRDHRSFVSWILYAYGADSRCTNDATALAVARLTQKTGESAGGAYEHLADLSPRELHDMLNRAIQGGVMLITITSKEPSQSCVLKPCENSLRGFLERNTKTHKFSLYVIHGKWSTLRFEDRMILSRQLARIFPQKGVLIKKVRRLVVYTCWHRNKRGNPYGHQFH